MGPRNLSSKESKTLATEAALAAADVAEAEAFDSDVLALDADVAALAAETFADAVAPSTVPDGLAAHAFAEYSVVLEPASSVTKAYPVPVPAHSLAFSL